MWARRDARLLPRYRREERARRSGRAWWRRHRDTPSSSSAVVGLRAAMSTSERSPKTTYAGTCCSAAIVRRSSRRRSKSSSSTMSSMPFSSTPRRSAQRRRALAAASRPWRLDARAGEPELDLASQQRACGRLQLERRVRGDVLAQVAVVDELADDARPLVARELLADAEDAELVVLPLQRPSRWRDRAARR